MTNQAAIQTMRVAGPIGVYCLLLALMAGFAESFMETGFLPGDADFRAWLGSISSVMAFLGLTAAAMFGAGFLAWRLGDHLEVED
jgi:hypothetical protein